jgi:hypothetical protein
VTDRLRDDARARDILFGTYWTSAGWRSAADRTTDPSDLEYAKAAGYMFEPRAASHDEWVRLAIEVGRRVTLDEAASAFVASLGGRRLASRSALGSLATVRYLEPHSYRPWSAVCAECGVSDGGRNVDLNVLSFERHKWGGVRHGDPIYAWFDLGVSARSVRTEETARDIDILNGVLDAARQAPPDANARDLERTIASTLPSNRAERDILLGILALSGVLAPPDHPGLLSTWVPVTERQPPPRPAKNDWLYPVFWWRGSVRVNEETAREVFGGRIR